MMDRSPQCRLRRGPEPRKGQGASRRYLLLATLVLAASCSFAQEVLSPLHARPRGTGAKPLKDDQLNEVFLYQYAPQTIPVIDDFSVDRTRHQDAQNGDPDVTLDQTIYRLDLGGQHTPDMQFMQDTAYHYTYTVTDDTTIVDTVVIAPSSVTVYDLSAYPVTSQVLDLWPPYDLIDTVGQTSTDTLHLDVLYTQDSMLVYQVAPQGGTYINPDNSTRPLILWQEDEAYVNGTFGKSPPSIGVATFDGMDRTGYPYDDVSPNNNGLADQLTSVPIGLNFPPGDSVYFSFFYQPVGNSGDSIDIQSIDSLRLEFYAPEEQVWYLVWSVPQVSVQPFKQVMIPIKDTKYLKDGFQMRFSNKATLAGSVDQWNVDYVRLGRNRAYTDTVLNDVAFVYPANSLLQTYSSVPFAKFQVAPTAYMAPSVDLLQRNLYTQDKFITWGYVSGIDGQAPTASFSGYGSNISNNAGITFNSTHPVNSAPNNYVYDISTSTDAAFLRTKFWTQATPDVCRYNDTTSVLQELSNYYSYDDGGAEWGYSLNQSGGKIAYRFDTQGDDSLHAVRMYFDPIFAVDDPRDGSFLITVWSSLDPEQIIFQNVSFSTPEFRRWGPDHFVEYALDSTIAVSGTFYVGWVQTTSTQMNLGFDIDRVHNDRMFFNVSGQWAQSSKPGSWMIRPVMEGGSDPFAGIAEPQAPVGLLLFPNPATDAFALQLADGTQQAATELMDATGRLVQRWPKGTARFSISDVAPGVYVVRATDAAGRTLAQGRLMVQH